MVVEQHRELWLAILDGDYRVTADINRSCYGNIRTWGVLWKKIYDSIFHILTLISCSETWVSESVIAAEIDRNFTGFRSKYERGALRAIVCDILFTVLRPAVQYLKKTAPYRLEVGMNKLCSYWLKESKMILSTRLYAFSVRPPLLQERLSK